MSASARPKFLEIVVAPDGVTTVEASGFADDSCHAATGPYEEALGTVADDKAKPEARVKATARVAAPARRKLDA